jgi:hypothetical protein
VLGIGDWGLGTGDVDWGLGTGDWGLGLETEDWGLVAGDLASVVWLRNHPRLKQMRAFPIVLKAILV